LIDVAPHPIFARLERPDDRVVAVVVVLCGVLVLRRVAAADMAAAETQPEVNPSVSERQTLLAPVGSREDVLDVAKVGAASHDALAAAEGPPRACVSGGNPSC
jgi:hypothetical protein